MDNLDQPQPIKRMLTYDGLLDGDGQDGDGVDSKKVEEKENTPSSSAQGATSLSQGSSQSQAMP
ncbi:MAG: hypothetical protein CMP18_01340 [Rickettsiales bacterium]|jgi:hypothetical protein|nr:hypothetical protein [Rickettsiales bacterium]|tara:strand:- start:2842 stop:3033 length:192 start_codon:yes stop_codon:yes gene_type:complete